MAKKPIKPKEYQKIPVAPDVYARVRMIADLHGRGMGDQVDAWTKQNLPMCDHKLQGVDIEYAPSAVDNLNYVVDVVRVGWYCATCNRVYEVLPAPTPSVKPVEKEAVTA